MCTAVVVLTVKLALLAVDSTPLYFLGDSATYIGAALESWVPPDRSYVYPLAIRVLAVWPQSLFTLVLAQTLASAASAWLLALLLVRFLLVPPLPAIVAAMALAVAPLQLLHERMVLTEAFALFVFALFLLLGSVYVRRPTLSSLAATSVVGIVLVSLRTVYVPVTLVAAFALPLLAWSRLRGRGAGVRPLGVHLAVGVLATLACHLGYRHWLGAMSGHPPAYLYADGLFAICAWSPVIVPEDADEPPAVRVLERMVARRGTEPHGSYYREALRWERGWLVDDLMHAYPDEYEANLVAKRIASRALLRDPLDVMRLAPTLFVHYARMLWGGGADGILRAEQGTSQPLPASFVAELRDAFGIDAAATPATPTPSKRFHRAAWPALVAPLLAPFLCVMLPWICRRDARSAALWVCGAFVVLAVGTFQFSLSPAFRYLHPFDLAAALVLAVVADAALRALPRPAAERRA